MKKISILLLTAILLSSCVSKKKYMALKQENGEIKSELTKTKVAKEDLENKFSKIQQRVDLCNTKINSLNEDVVGLKIENDIKLDVNADGTVISNESKRKMIATLKSVDSTKLAKVKTFKDSMNVAIQHNLSKVLESSNSNEDDDIAVNINEAVVMISISDKMLFNSGSYKISNKANIILQKLADVINSEESINVMVEGHTGSRTINT